MRNVLRSKKYKFVLSDSALQEATRIQSERKASTTKPIGPASDEDLIKPKAAEKPKVVISLVLIS